MAQFRIGDIIADDNSPMFEAALAHAYSAHVRPMCLCHGEPGIPMYVAFANAHHWIKRMPNSGKTHAARCSSWEMPEVFSGLSDLYHTAVTYEEDTIKLRLDFALFRKGAAPPPGSTALDKPSAKTDGKKFTLRSFLHYLWDEAGLTKWDTSSPRRNWSYVHDHLTEAAMDKSVKKSPLLDFLFVPRPWTRETADEAERLRLARFANASSGDQKAPHKLQVLIGEVKDIKEAMGGDYVVSFYHLPTVMFMMDKSLYKKLHDRSGFEREWKTYQALILKRRSLIMAATFSVAAGGAPILDEALWMCTTGDYIPIESVYDDSLIQDLQKEHRAFAKVMRGDRPRGMIMPGMLLTDHGPDPVAMYVVDPDAKASLHDVQETAQAAPYKSWIWDMRANGGHSPSGPVFPARLPAGPPAAGPLNTAVAAAVEKVASAVAVAEATTVRASDLLPGQPVRDQHAAPRIG